MRSQVTSHMIESKMGLYQKPLVAYLLVFITLFVNIFARQYVPVLLWESSDVSKKETHSPALLKKSTDDFTDFILKRVNYHHEKPLIVVFTEETLSVEDFIWEDKVEHGSFPLLESLTAKSSNVDFLPSVNSPVKAFKDLGNKGFTIHTLDLATGHTFTPQSYSSGSVLIIKLDSADYKENRPEYLKRHDQTILDIYNQLVSKHTNLIAAYTGHYSSYFESDATQSHRVRRLMAAPEAETNGTRLWRDTENKIFLYWAGNFPELSNKSEPNSTVVVLKDPYEIKSDETAAWQRLIAKFKTSDGNSITLRFRFPFIASGYWSFSEIEYVDQNSKQELILSTSSLIEAPFNFSYHCGGNILFSNGSTMLMISKIQVQPFLSGVERFSDAYDCVWFFTPAIWSGIFVTTILAFIFIWGISMIMDIKTMDRFDDPKGKTITIGATD